MKTGKTHPPPQASGAKSQWTPFLLALAATLVLLFLAKGWIAKGLIENSARLATGLTLRMRRLDLSLARTTVGATDLALHNPSGFPDPVMVRLPEIFVDYNLGEVLAGKVHLTDVRFHLAEFAVVRNAKGELNVNALRPVQAQRRREPRKAPRPSRAKAPPKVEIDRFSLRIDRVVFKDYARGGTPVVKVFPIHLNERFTNLHDVNQIVLLVVARVMMSTPVAALTNFDAAAVKAGVSDALASSKRIAAEAAAQASVALRASAADAEDALEDASRSLETGADRAAQEAKSLAENLKSQASVLKEKLNLAFGEGNESR